MRIFYLANNWVGYKIAKFLIRRQHENIVGLAIHPQSKRKFGNEIIDVLGLKDDQIFLGNKLNNSDVHKRIEALKPDLCLSVYFGYILRLDFINLFPKGCFNIHPSYLPYNKGAHPNVWSIMDGTQAGVTIHQIDEGIDTGPIVKRKAISVLPWDTAQTLYHKLERASVELFEATWDGIKNQKFELHKLTEEGTHHFVKDLCTLDKIDLNKEYKAADLINILRARTFPPYKGTYIEVNGKRIYINISLIPDDEGNAN